MHTIRSNVRSIGQDDDDVGIVLTIPKHHHKTLRQIRCPNMTIVFTMSMHLKVQTQSIVGSLHQIFPASLNSSPRVSF